MSGGTDAGVSGSPPESAVVDETQEICWECAGDGCYACGETGFVFTRAEVERRVNAEDHAARVAASFPVGSLSHSVALYHDHLEDSLGEVPAAILHHVEVLTRRDGEIYRRYIRRVRRSGDSIAIAVKAADLRDNIARCRGEFGGEVSPARERHYLRTLDDLGWSSSATADFCPPPPNAPNNFFGSLYEGKT